MKQVTTAQLPSIKKQLLVRQKNICAVCGHKFTRTDDAVVDHDHGTGIIRGAIHRSCNMAEGKIKVKANRGHKGVKAEDLIIGLGKYLEHHKTPKVPYIHPQHMTPDMKRIARNRKAQILRTKKKLLAEVKK